MIDKDMLIKSAISAFFTLLASQPILAAGTDDASTNFEKCYGVVKAGMNDCATAKSSCAGSSKKDRQPDAFVFTPPGLCAKLVGGNLKDPTESKSKK